MNGHMNRGDGKGHEREGMGRDMNKRTDERAHEQGGQDLSRVAESQLIRNMRYAECGMR